MKNVVGKSDANSLGRRLCIDTYSFIYPFRKNGIEAGVNDEETKSRNSGKLVELLPVEQDLIQK